MNRVFPVLVNEREIGTLLAALRYWQSRQTGRSAGAMLDDIASNGGDFAPLNENEIDDLCERINIP